jgi:hypothetical protein
MFKHHHKIAVLGVALASCVSSTAMAAGAWHYGIGTGLSTFGLDGDLGFATPVGGRIEAIDLDADDTSDMLDSALGANAFATNGEWQFLLSYNTVTLEDNNSNVNVEWDRTNVELAAVYNFAKTGSNTWGALAGLRYTDHEWDISSRNGSFSDVKPDDDWTDFIVGFTHVLAISNSWSWRNRIDGGFGDTEEAWFASTGLFWQPLDNWMFNAGVRYLKTEVGDEDDINDSNFYLYNVDETAFGLGVSYIW